MRDSEFIIVFLVHKFHIYLLIDLLQTTHNFDEEGNVQVAAAQVRGPKGGIK